MRTAPRILAAASSAFLFLAAFAGSTGLRVAMLLVASAVLLLDPRATWAALRTIPRSVAIAGLLWIALAIASYAWSVDPAYTLSELKAEILYGTIVFLVFFTAASRVPALWNAWWVALATGAALAYVAHLVQVYGGVVLLRHQVDAGSGPYSTHLVLLLPLLLALVWPAPWGRGLHPRLLAAALVVVLAAAWESGNRIVWVAFAVQLVVMALAWRSLPGEAAPDARFARRAALAALAAIAIAFAGSLAERDEKNLLHPAGVAPGVANDLRPRIWAAAEAEIVRAPWLGHGFGREIMAPTFEPLTPSGAHPLLLHGHDTFIDVMLQLGTAGLAVFVALLAALVLRYGAMLRTPALVPLGIMGLALIAGYVVKNLTDDFLHRQNALIFWAANAILLGLARSPRAD